MVLRPAALAVAVACFATPLAAQCANGAPPPCTTAASARRDPPLDSRKWIVLPFTNSTRAPELNWLSDASVRLLYIDMSRWTDLTVVDDERVASLLRGVPDGARTQLRLAAGLDIAKREGAGKLVMGDYLNEGARTTYRKNLRRPSRWPAANRDAACDQH